MALSKVCILVDEGKFPAFMFIFFEVTTSGFQPAFMPNLTLHVTTCLLSAEMAETQLHSEVITDFLLEKFVHNAVTTVAACKKAGKALIPDDNSC